MRHSQNGKACAPRRRMATLAATGAVLGTCSLGMSPAAQATTTTTLQYTCSFPLIGDQPMTASVVWNGTPTHRVDQATPLIPMTVSATISPETVTALNLVGAKSVKGTADAPGEVVAPQGEIDRTIAMTVGKTAVPNSGSLTLVAAGMLPSVVFTQTGSGQVEVGNTFNLSFTPETASGGQTVLGVVNTTCTLNPGQSGVIATFEVLAAASASTSTTPAAKPSTSSGHASGSGTSSLVSVASAANSAARNPVGSPQASASADPTVSSAESASASASASASTAARDPRRLGAQHPHSTPATAQALAITGGAAAVGAMAVIVWWLGRRRRKNAQAMAVVSVLPAVQAVCRPGVEADGAEQAVAEPISAPIAVSGKQLRVVSVSARSTQTERDYAGASMNMPHKAMGGPARRSLYDRRQRTVALDRHCRGRDRQSAVRH